MLYKRFFCLISAFVLIFSLAGCSTPSPKTPLQKFSAEFPELFDTVTTLTCYAESREEFDRYADIVRTQMMRLHRLFDIYHGYEGVNNLYTVNENAGIAPVEVDTDIIDMLAAALEGYDFSGGALNVALGPVLRIWHEYRTDGVALPPMDMLREASGLADIGELIIDRDNGTIFLQKKGMSLDVGAVGKAYAAGRALDAAREQGMTSAILNAGGNIITVGAPAVGDRDWWNVGVQNPDLDEGGAQTLLDSIKITGDMTVSTSGGYQRFYLVDGVSYNHIIDPETLMPASRYKQVTVVHKTAALADLLSTTLFILPYEQGAGIAERYNAEVLWVDLDDVWRATAGYSAISQVMGGQ